MCVCKLHLHVRWAIKAVLKLTKNQNINTPFTSYESFFKYLYSSDCVLPDDSSEYIKWSSIPEKNHLCDEIKKFRQLEEKPIVTV